MSKPQSLELYLGAQRCKADGLGMGTLWAEQIFFNVMILGCGPGGSGHSELILLIIKQLKS
jgi:hypothetical protein